MKLGPDWKVLFFAIILYTFGEAVGHYHAPWWVGSAGMGLVGFFCDRIVGWVRA